MLSVSVQTQTDPEICNEALRDQHKEALALFRKGTQRLRNAKNDNKSIIQARRTLYKADGLCKEADYFGECLQQVPPPQPVLPAGAAFPASARVVDAAGKPNAMAVADNKSRVILVGAVAAAGNPNAMAVADDKSRSIRGGPAPSDAGQKRAAAALAKPDIVDLVSSDDEAGPKKPCLSKPTAAAGGVAKAPAEVVYAAVDGNWHDDVHELQCELTKMGKFNFGMLNVEAKDQLRTLPYEVALVLLGKIRDEETKIRNVNAFIVKNGEHLRNQFSLDNVETVLEEIEPQNADATESESSATEDDEGPPDVDCDGHSIEY